MDKRQQRTQKKRQHILQTALALFMQYGADKVGMDEIADQANVSKVTIYKYFGSKQELHTETINLFIDETFAATEALLNSDLDFLEKFKRILLMKSASFDLGSLERFFQIWDTNQPTGLDLRERLQDKTKDIMVRFYQQGIDEGYINPTVSFEVLYLYADIVRAGFRAKQIDLDSTLMDKDLLDQLLDIYFFGFLKRP